MADKKPKVPHFVIYKSSGEFRWRFLARNGKILATGESFKTLKSCKHSIAVIQMWSGQAPVIEDLEEKVKAVNSVPHRKRWSGKKPEKRS